MLYIESMFLIARECQSDRMFNFVGCIFRAKTCITCYRLLYKTQGGHNYHYTMNNLFRS